jgi:hypothetical protein
MRIKALAIAGIVGWLGVPGMANAVPAAPAAAPTGISTQPELLPVRDGCGRGWYLAQWRDQWGRWHRRCVPMQARGPGPWAGGPGPWAGPPHWSPGPWHGPHRGPDWRYYR